MRVVIHLSVARFAEEGHEDETEHIEGGDARGAERDYEKNVVVHRIPCHRAIQNARQDGVFAPEPGEHERYPRD